MTTHQDSNPSAEPARPAGRAVTAALVLAVPAGLAWIGGMIYTVIAWTS
ncbi:morphogenic membrane protein MmpA [Streptomyces sp. NPDC005070]